MYIYIYTYIYTYTDLNVGERREQHLVFRRVLRESADICAHVNFAWMGHSQQSAPGHFQHADTP